MNETIDVVLHGLFTFFEDANGGVCAVLPNVRTHYAAIVFDNGQEIDPVPEGRIYLEGVKDGNKRLLDPDADFHHICTFENATSVNAEPKFFEVVLPPPAHVDASSIPKMKNKIQVTSGKILNPDMLRFADKITLTYEVDGTPKLANITIERRVSIISGPRADHGPSHRSHAFRAGVRHITGVDATWDGEVDKDVARVDPPGCSASSGSKSGGS